MTACPEYLALLRGVLLDPAADLPRLVLADWLEENGDEQDGLRAQFVRLQVELGPAGDVSAGRKWADGLGRMGSRLCELQSLFFFARMRSSRSEGWARASFPAVACFRGLHNLSMSRGFPDHAVCSAGQFLRHAKTLFSQAPITRVTLDDRRQRSGEPATRWVRSGGLAKWSAVFTDETLPAPLFNCLPQSVGRHTRQGIGLDRGNTIWHREVEYDSPEEAAEALSAACVRRGRRLAGLPPLPTEEKQ
jgi:uncharacterized protein (TIGR02996 family)